MAAASAASAVLATGLTLAVVDRDAGDGAGTDTAAAVDGSADGGTNNSGTTSPGAAAGSTVDPTPVESTGASGSAAVAAARVAPAVVQIQTRTGVGSGVVYDPSGLVLTVAHVVGNQAQVEVRLADGSTVVGDVVGTDALTDVAVVRIDPDAIVAVADLATDTELVVGELAVAVGSPFGFDQTVTAGIVSAVDRVVNDVTMVQTDAAINPGNSGGPLVNADGAVIGLSDVIFTESGGNEGVGFAVQIDLARIVADQLVAGQDVRLAQLGVSTTAAADGSSGAQVASVVPDSAAAAAGIEVGDLLVSLDGAPMTDSGQLRAQIIRREPGSQVTIGVVRDGQTLDVAVTLGSTAT